MRLKPCLSWCVFACVYILGTVASAQVLSSSSVHFRFTATFDAAFNVTAVTDPIPQHLKHKIADGVNANCGSQCSVSEHNISLVSSTPVSAHVYEMQWNILMKNTAASVYATTPDSILPSAIFQDFSVAVPTATSTAFVSISEQVTDIVTTSAARPDACGDGVIGFDEECDDQNRVDGDGCSAFCVFEDGFMCKQGIRLDGQEAVQGHILLSSVVNGSTTYTVTTESETCQGPDVCQIGGLWTPESYQHLYPANFPLPPRGFYCSDVCRNFPVPNAGLEVSSTCSLVDVNECAKGLAVCDFRALCSDETFNETTGKGYSCRCEENYFASKADGLGCVDSGFEVVFGVAGQEGYAGDPTSDLANMESVRAAFIAAILTRGFLQPTANAQILSEQNIDYPPTFVRILTETDYAGRALYQVKVRLASVLVDPAAMVSDDIFSSLSSLQPIFTDTASPPAFKLYTEKKCSDERDRTCEHNADCIQGGVCLDAVPSVSLASLNAGGSNAPLYRESSGMQIVSTTYSNTETAWLVRLRYKPTPDAMSVLYVSHVQRPLTGEMTATFLADEFICGPLGTGDFQQRRDDTVCCLPAFRDLYTTTQGFVDYLNDTSKPLAREIVDQDKCKSRADAPANSSLELLDAALPDFVSGAFARMTRSTATLDPNTQGGYRDINLYLASEDMRALGGIENSIDGGFSIRFFVGMAHIKPLSTPQLSVSHSQLDIRSDITNTFFFQTSAQTDFTFLKDVNVNLLQIKNQTMADSGAAGDPYLKFARVQLTVPDTVTADDLTGILPYNGLMARVGYTKNTAVSVPLDGIATSAMYPCLNVYTGAMRTEIDHLIATQEYCSFQDPICATIGPVPVNAGGQVSFIIPLLGDYWERETASSGILTKRLYLDFVLSVRDANGKRVLTNVETSTEITTLGINSLCEEKQLRSAIDDIMSIDLFLGLTPNASAFNDSLVQALDITRSEEPVHLSRDISSKSANVLTMLLKGSDDTFSNLYAKDYSLQVEDMITVHFLDLDKKAQVEQLIADNRAVFQKTTASENSEMRLFATDELLSLCPMHSTRNVLGCLTRKEIDERNLDIVTRAVTHISPEDPDDLPSVIANAGLWTQSVLGDSEFANNLGKQHAKVFNDIYNLNHRYRKGYMISPTIPWTKTNMASEGFTSSIDLAQTSISFFLVSFSQNLERSWEPVAQVAIPSAMPVSVDQFRQDLELQNAIASAYAQGLGKTSDEVSIDQDSIRAGGSDARRRLLQDNSTGLPTTEFEVVVTFNDKETAMEEAEEMVDIITADDSQAAQAIFEQVTIAVSSVCPECPPPSAEQIKPPPELKEVMKSSVRDVASCQDPIIDIDLQAEVGAPGHATCTGRFANDGSSLPIGVRGPLTDDEWALVGPWYSKSRSYSAGWQQWDMCGEVPWTWGLENDVEQAAKDKWAALKQKFSGCCMCLSKPKKPNSRSDYIHKYSWGIPNSMLNEDAIFKKGEWGITAFPYPHQTATELTWNLIDFSWLHISLINPQIATFRQGTNDPYISQEGLPPAHWGFSKLNNGWRIFDAKRGASWPYGCPQQGYAVQDVLRGCEICPIGSYHHTTSPAPSCFKCKDDTRGFGDHKTTAALGSFGGFESNCFCEPGYFGTSQSCQECPANTYKDTVSNNVADCKPCPAMTISRAGSTSLSACIPAVVAGGYASETNLFKPALGLVSHSTRVVAELVSVPADEQDNSRLCTLDDAKTGLECPGLTVPSAFPRPIQSADTADSLRPNELYASDNVPGLLRFHDGGSTPQESKRLIVHTFPDASKQYLHNTYDRDDLKGLVQRVSLPVKKSYDGPAPPGFYEQILTGADKWQVGTKISLKLRLQVPSVNLDSESVRVGVFVSSKVLNTAADSTDWQWIFCGKADGSYAPCKNEPDPDNAGSVNLKAPHIVDATIFKLSSTKSCFVDGIWWMDNCADMAKAPTNDMYDSVYQWAPLLAVSKENMPAGPFYLYTVFFVGPSKACVDHGCNEAVFYSTMSSHVAEPFSAANMASVDFLPGSTVTIEVKPETESDDSNAFETAMGMVSSAAYKHKVPLEGFDALQLTSLYSRPLNPDCSLASDGLRTINCTASGGATHENVLVRNVSLSGSTTVGAYAVDYVSITQTYKMCCTDPLNAVCEIEEIMCMDDLHSATSGTLEGQEHTYNKAFSFAEAQENWFDLLNMCGAGENEACACSSSAVSAVDNADTAQPHYQPIAAVSYPGEILYDNNQAEFLAELPTYEDNNFESYGSQSLDYPSTITMTLSNSFQIRVWNWRGTRPFVNGFFLNPWKATGYLEVFSLVPGKTYKYSIVCRNTEPNNDRYTYTADAMISKFSVNSGDQIYLGQDASTTPTHIGEAEADSNGKLLFTFTHTGDKHTHLSSFNIIETTPTVELSETANISFSSVTFFEKFTNAGFGAMPTGQCTKPIVTQAPCLDGDAVVLPVHTKYWRTVFQQSCQISFKYLYFDGVEFISVSGTNITRMNAKYEQKKIWADNIVNINEIDADPEFDFVHDQTGEINLCPTSDHKISSEGEPFIVFYAKPEYKLQPPCACNVLGELPLQLVGWNGDGLTPASTKPNIVTQARDMTACAWENCESCPTFTDSNGDIQSSCSHLTFESSSGAVNVQSGMFSVQGPVSGDASRVDVLASSSGADGSFVNVGFFDLAAASEVTTYSALDPTKVLALQRAKPSLHAVLPLQYHCHLDTCADDCAPGCHHPDFLLNNTVASLSLLQRAEYPRWQPASSVQSPAAGEQAVVLKYDDPVSVKGFQWAAMTDLPCQTMSELGAKVWYLPPTTSSFNTGTAVNLQHDSQLQFATNGGFTFIYKTKRTGSSQNGYFFDFWDPLTQTQMRFFTHSGNVRFLIYEGASCELIVPQSSWTVTELVLDYDDSTKVFSATGLYRTMGWQDGVLVEQSTTAINQQVTCAGSFALPDVDLTAAQAQGAFEMRVSGNEAIKADVYGLILFDKKLPATASAAMLAALDTTHHSQYSQGDTPTADHSSAAALAAFDAPCVSAGGGSSDALHDKMQISYSDDGTTWQTLPDVALTVQADAADISEMLGTYSIPAPHHTATYWKFSPYGGSKSVQALLLQPCLLDSCADVIGAQFWKLEFVDGVELLHVGLCDTEDCSGRDSTHAATLQASAVCVAADTGLVVSESGQSSFCFEEKVASNDCSQLLVSSPALHPVEADAMSESVETDANGITNAKVSVQKINGQFVRVSAPDPVVSLQQTFMQLDAGNDVFVQLDMGASKSVQKVKLYPHAGGNANSLHNYKIWIGDDASFDKTNLTPCAQYDAANDDLGAVVSKTCINQGRYLYIEFDASQSLEPSLSSVVVVPAHWQFTPEAKWKWSSNMIDPTYLPLGFTPSSGSSSDPSAAVFSGSSAWVQMNLDEMQGIKGLQFYTGSLDYQGGNDNKVRAWPGNIQVYVSSKDDFNSIDSTAALVYQGEIQWNYNALLPDTRDPVVTFDTVRAAKYVRVDVQRANSVEVNNANHGLLVLRVGLLNCMYKCVGCCQQTATIRPAQFPSLDFAGLAAGTQNAVTVQKYYAPHNKCKCVSDAGAESVCPCSPNKCDTEKYTLLVDSGEYKIDTKSTPILQITRGEPLTIHWPAAHPVVVSGQNKWQGSPLAGAVVSTENMTTTVTIPVDFKGHLLYYYCDNHESMPVGLIEVLDSGQAPVESDCVKPMVLDHSAFNTELSFEKIDTSVVFDASFDQNEEQYLVQTPQLSPHIPGRSNIFDENPVTSTEWKPVYADEDAALATGRFTQWLSSNNRILNQFDPLYTAKIFTDNGNVQSISLPTRRGYQGPGAPGFVQRYAEWDVDAHVEFEPNIYINARFPSGTPREWEPSAQDRYYNYEDGTKVHAVLAVTTKQLDITPMSTDWNWLVCGELGEHALDFPPPVVSLQTSELSGSLPSNPTNPAQYEYAGKSSYKSPSMFVKQGGFLPAATGFADADCKPLDTGAANPACNTEYSVEMTANGWARCDLTQDLKTQGTCAYTLGDVKRKFFYDSANRFDGATDKLTTPAADITRGLDLRTPEVHLGDSGAVMLSRGRLSLCHQDLYGAMIDYTHNVAPTARRGLFLPQQPLDNNMIPAGAGSGGNLEQHCSVPLPAGADESTYLQTTPLLDVLNLFTNDLCMCGLVFTGHAGSETAFRVVAAPDEHVFVSKLSDTDSASGNPLGRAFMPDQDLEIFKTDPATTLPSSTYKGLPAKYSACTDAVDPDTGKAQTKNPHVLDAVVVPLHRTPKAKLIHGDGEYEQKVELGRDGCSFAKPHLKIFKSFGEGDKVDSVWSDLDWSYESLKDIGIVRSEDLSDLYPDMTGKRQMLQQGFGVYDFETNIPQCRDSIGNECTNAHCKIVNFPCRFHYSYYSDWPGSRGCLIYSTDPDYCALSKKVMGFGFIDQVYLDEKGWTTVCFEQSTSEEYWYVRENLGVWSKQISSNHHQSNCNADGLWPVTDPYHFTADALVVGGGRGVGLDVERCPAESDKYSREFGVITWNPQLAQAPTAPVYLYQFYMVGESTACAKHGCDEHAVYDTMADHLDEFPFADGRHPITIMKGSRLTVKTPEKAPFEMQAGCFEIMSAVDDYSTGARQTMYYVQHLVANFAQNANDFAVCDASNTVPCKFYDSGADVHYYSIQAHNADGTTNIFTFYTAAPGANVQDNEVILKAVDTDTPGAPGAFRSAFTRAVGDKVYTTADKTCAAASGRRRLLAASTRRVHRPPALSPATRSVLRLYQKKRGLARRAAPRASLRPVRQRLPVTRRKLLSVGDSAPKTSKGANVQREITSVDADATLAMRSCGHAGVCQLVSLTFDVPRKDYCLPEDDLLDSINEQLRKLALGLGTTANMTALSVYRHDIFSTCFGSYSYPRRLLSELRAVSVRAALSVNEPYDCEKAEDCYYRLDMSDTKLNELGFSHFRTFPASDGGVAVRVCYKDANDDCGSYVELSNVSTIPRPQDGPAEKTSSSLSTEAVLLIVVLSLVGVYLLVMGGYYLMQPQIEHRYVPARVNDSIECYTPKHGMLYWPGHPSSGRHGDIGYQM